MIDKMIKVLFVHNSVPEYRVGFWKRLSKRVDLTILITSGYLADKIYGLEKNVSGLNLQYWKKDTFRILKTAISNYDVVVLPHADAIFEYYVGCFLVKICKANKVKCVYWSIKWEPPFNTQPILKKGKNIVQRYMTWNLGHRCDCSIAAGKKANEYYELVGIKKDRIKIVYESNSSPEPKKKYSIRRKYGIPEEAKIILYFGRVIKRKGCDLLIDACGSVLSSNVWLLIIGDGEYLEHCKMLSEGKNIVFGGKIQPAERKIYYEQSDVFVLPSINDNGVIEVWGFTVNESMECGTPVISTDAVGAAYDLIKAESGIMVKEGNVKELREALDHILTNAYSRQAIKKVYQKYSVKNMADEYYNALTFALYS